MQTVCIIVLSSFERLAALASGSRSGARWTAVTPEESPSFCMSVCVPGVPVVVVVVDRPRYMRFVFSLCHHRLALLLPLLLPSRIFSFPARSALLRRSQEPFYVKPHRVAHTHTCENDDNEAMGLTLENW